MESFATDLSSGKLLSIDRDFLRLPVFWIFASFPFVVTVAALCLILFPTTFDDVPPPTGCRKLGLKGASNLAGEHLAQETDDKSSQKTTSHPHGGPYRVKSIWIYPVKSCRGVELYSSTVLQAGLQYDRQFSLAHRITPRPNSKTGEQQSPYWKFLTQRDYPLLSQVTTEMWIPDPRNSLYGPDLPYVQSGGAVILTFPHPCRGVSGFFRRRICALFGTSPTKLAIMPFDPTPAQIADAKYTIENFTIWKDTVPALNMGVHIPRELTEYLGFPPSTEVSIFRVAEEKEREVFRCAPRKDVLGYQPVVGFADAYPVNILGVASVRALSAMQPHGSARLSARRFRPNILFEGARGFAEDEWKKVRVVSAEDRKDERGREFFVCCRCLRCKVPNIEPDTGIRDRNEPDTTLRGKRNIDKGAPRLGSLGMQMVPVLKEGKVQVGDEVVVLEVGEHEYIPQ